MEEDKNRWGKYSAFSLYQDLSKDIYQKIFKAVTQISRVEAGHDANEKIKIQDAAEAKGSLLTAMRLLKADMKEDRDKVDLYNEILTKWENGTMQKVYETNFVNNFPEEMRQLLDDLLMVSKHLGYTKAGHRKALTPEEEIEDLIEQTGLK